MIKYCPKCNSKLYSYTFGDIIRYSCNDKIMFFYFSLQNEFMSLVVDKFHVTKNGIIKKYRNKIYCDLNILIKDEKEAYFYLNKYLENIIFD